MAFRAVRSFEQWAKELSIKYDNKYLYTGLVTRNNKPHIVGLCTIHGEFVTDASAHLGGKGGCKFCNIASRATSATVTFEQFLEKAKKIHGDTYQYLTYTPGKRRAHSKFTAICKIHGEFEQYCGHHLKGHKCAKCGFEQTADSLRHVPEQWLEKFKAIHGDNYIYPTELPVGSDSRIDITCPKHGVFNQSLIRHSVGDGCPSCGFEKTREAIRYDFYTAINKAQDVHGDRYLYLGIGYGGPEDRVTLKFICPEHGYQEQRIGSHYVGHGCRACSIESRASGRRLVYEELVKEFCTIHENKYTYKALIPSDETTFAKIVAVCPRHGEFVQLVSGHMNGNGCPSCGTRVSKANREIAEFLKSSGLEVELEYQIVISDTRRIFADIYVPEANLVIEHLGIRWHSTLFKEPDFLRERQEAVEKLGYSFIAIYSDEWTYRRPQIEKLLLSRCGINSGAISARKCTVVEVSRADGNEFITANHIQTYNSTVATYLGLQYMGKLVAVMAFTTNTSNRGQTASVDLWELSRFCSSTRVVGGASRLLSAFLDRVPEARKLVTFSDRRVFRGDMYKVLGFAVDSELPPDYTYVVGRHRKHKRGFQKSDLLAMFPEATAEQTEREITENNGIYRIYDSGKLRWSRVLR